MIVVKYRLDFMNDFLLIVQPPPKRVMASIKISLPLNSLKRRLPEPVILLNSFEKGENS